MVSRFVQAGTGDDPSDALNDIAPGRTADAGDSGEPPDEWFLIRGNCVDELTRQMVLVPESRRAFWWAAIYVPEPWDVTVMQLSVSPTLHDVAPEDLLKDREFVKLDYDNMRSFNLDDCHFIDERLGTLDSNTGPHARE